MSYKVGDKFVIEIKGKIPVNNKIGEYVYKTTDNGINSAEVLDNLPQLVNGVDMASYNKGLTDCWDMMKKINNMHSEELCEVTGQWYIGDVLARCDAITVKKDMDAHENKIRIGDEVKDHHNAKAVVIKLGETNAHIVYNDGAIAYMGTRHLTKTGNNYAAELKELLGKIGGESE